MGSMSHATACTSAGSTGPMKRNIPNLVMPMGISRYLQINLVALGIFGDKSSRNAKLKTYDLLWIMYCVQTPQICMHTLSWRFSLCQFCGKQHVT